MMWLQFFICAGVIVWAGVRLTTYTDRLSDRLQLGKVWIGVVLLGFVTSLPEVITSLSAMISLKADDLAIGNLLGSNSFNPMLLVVMDIAYRKGSVTSAIRPHFSHTVSALCAVMLSLTVGVGIYWNLGWIASGMIAVMYFGGMYYLARLEKKEEFAEAPLTPEGQMSLIQIYCNLALSAGLVIGAAIFLANIADVLAETTGLGRTFFGSIFLAFVTSLPEMVVSLSALRLGAFDLAVGNIFGSNMTNMFIVPVCDIFHQGDSILNGVSTTHIFMVGLSVVLTLVVLGGMRYKNKKTFLGLGVDSFIMIVLFIIGTRVLYQLR